MKLFDKILREWRTKVAKSYMAERTTAVFDIGCDDGYLLHGMSAAVKVCDGCDPRLDANCSEGRVRRFRDSFPMKQLPLDVSSIKYDSIFALAVFEHFNEQDLNDTGALVSRMLNVNGRLIASVPHPFVDRILDVLMLFKLVDGQATDEHHGFDVNRMETIFGKHLKLVERRRFQLGLNNIFVYEKL